MINKKIVMMNAFKMTEYCRWNNVDWPQWLHKAWNYNINDIGAVYPTNYFNNIRDRPGTISIRTFSGSVLVCFDDWIVLNSQGKIFSCKPDVFKRKYSHLFFLKNLGMLED